MANEQNLIKNEDLTPRERRENAKKAGEASAKARREKKLMRETLEILLQMPIKSGKQADIEAVKNFAALQGKNITVQDALSIAMVKRAIKGSVQAAEWIRDTAGQKPVDNMNITGNVNNPFEGLTTEELRQLIKDD